VAIEGTAILAREKSERLRGRVDVDLLTRAARLLIEPGISVVSATLAAANVGEVVYAMSKVFCLLLSAPHVEVE
jgi:hypothetical protein